MTNQYWNQIEVIKNSNINNLLSSPIELDYRNQYLDVDTYYMSTIMAKLIKNNKGELYCEILPFCDQGLVMKTIKFNNPELLEEIRIEIGGSIIDRIHNKNNIFNVLRNIYNIRDAQIIPFNCTIGNNYIPELAYHQIIIFLKFKDVSYLDKIEDHILTYEIYQTDIDWKNCGMMQNLIQTVQYDSVFFSRNINYVKLNFSHFLVTHLIISIDNVDENDIDSIDFKLSSKTTGITFTYRWEKNNENILVQKIYNNYIITFVSKNGNHLQNFQGINFMNSNLSLRINKSTLCEMREDPIFIHVHTISSNSVRILNGMLGLRISK